MVHNFKNTLAGVLAVACLMVPSLVMAEIDMTGAAGGVSYATPMGDNYQGFKKALGFKAHLWAQNESLLGNVFQFHSSAGLHSFKVEGAPKDISLSLQQWMFLAGLETGRHGNSNWIKPFVSLDLGVAYTLLNAPSGYKKNDSIRFATEFRSGFEIPVWGKFSLEFAAPIGVVWGKNSFVTLSGEGLLRWAL